jgi:Tol biopolymer transport system component/tRNA A-37 threonylcarbamoyl transferase component Bud32
VTPEQWARVKDIYTDAMELPIADRAEYAVHSASDDPGLLAEILRLLKESEHQTDLLSRPALADTRVLGQEEAPRFAPSTVLARRFRVVRFISRGGMGEVYEAEDVALGERVALKAIRRGAALDADLRALFKREIQLARRVTHANVCRIFDLAQHQHADDDEPTLLLSMELIEGQTLAEHLRLSGPLNYRSALPLIEEIAAGLQAVHDAGIVHGDLKPGNVMLVVRPGETQPHARVMDFGMAFPVGQAPAARGSTSPTGDSPIAAVSGDGPTITLQSPGPHLRGGTPDYFAPEQLAGEPATTATDVYALALVIGEMLGVPRESRLHPDSSRMPGKWASILQRCLSSDPQHRFKGPAEVADALRDTIQPRRGARRTALVAVCAVIALAVAAKRIDVFRGAANRRLFTDSKSSDIWCASPDGSSLAGTSWDTGNLVLTDVGSGKVRPLTNHGPGASGEYGGAFGAVFAPDGRRIAYEWTNSRNDFEIRVIGTDGKNDRRLFHGDNLYVFLLDWSPDGKQLLVRVQNAQNEQKLGTISTQDGAVHYLEKQPVPAHGGRILFADDNSLVFDAKEPLGGGHEIRRLQLTGEESVLVPHAGASSVVGWSHDRSRLIYSSDLRGHTGIWAVAVSGARVQGEPREMVPNAIDWEPLGITRDGRLFYRHDASSQDVYTAVLDLAAGRTISPPQRVTTRFIARYAFPNWSEDGKRLSFFSTRERLSPMIAIYDTAAHSVRELEPGFSFLRPQWVEHDAALMVLGSIPDGPRGLIRVDPQTGQSKLFRTSKELDIYMEGVFSGDGKFYFNRYADQRRGFFRLDLETGERRVLYVPPPGILIGMENLALSPDGRSLAFHARSEGKGTGSLMVVPADGGGDARELLVVRRPESFPFGSFTWTRDSQAVLTVRTRSLERSHNDEKVSEIWLVPIDGSAPRKIDFPVIALACLRLSPDGKTIAFQVFQDRREIWFLQNFL